MRKILQQIRQLQTPTVKKRKLETRNSPPIVLSGDGLQFIILPQGSLRSIDFGERESDIVKKITLVLQAPAVKRGKNLDCGASFAIWKNGLTIWFLQEKFAGWSVAKNQTKFKTAGGIGLGSTRADLEATYAATVKKTSLGIEFNAGGLAGILSSVKQDAKITGLWAGMSCIGR